MKTRILPAIALLLLAQLVIGQERQRSRSPYLLHASMPHVRDAARGSAPPNDECANAEAINVTADCTASIAGNNAEATNDGADVSCDDPGADLLDVWYAFNSGSDDTVAITLTPGPDMEDWAFALYDGCAGTELACAIVPFAPLNVAVALNTDYWLRVYSNSTYGVGGSFTVCVTGPVAVIPPPANDECAGAVPQSVPVGSTVTFQGDNTGATDTEALGLGSAWEAFILTEEADVTVDYCGTAPAFESYFVVLFTGCPISGPIYPGSYDTTACGDSNGSMCFPGLSAGTYYHPVMAGPMSTGAYVLNVTAEPPGSNAVGNDECAGAVPILPGTLCTPQTFSNGCASESLPASDCGAGAGVANDDVWYSFTATSSEMSIGVLPSANGNMDPVIELFTGACGALTSLACADEGGQTAPEDLQASALTAGVEYYFRVYDHRLQYSTVDPSYDLCVVEGLGSGVGVQEAFAELNGRVCPNPSNGTFTIRANSGAMITAVQVVDAAGRTVLRSTSNTAHGPLQVDASALTPGAYVVRYTDSGTLKNERLIIQ